MCSALLLFLYQGEDEDAQFEVGADGKIRLRDGKKKIDLSKLTDDDLRKLGIDPTLDKKEIARLLKEKFGGDILISDGDRIIPTKRASEYGSDANTDDLANDEDLDVSTRKYTHDNILQSYIDSMHEYPYFNIEVIYVMNIV